MFSVWRYLSMSLVAYGDSDCESDEDNDITSEVKKPTLPNNNVRVEIKPIGTKPFLTLPQPKSVEPIKTTDGFDEEPAITSKKPTVNNCVQEKKEERPLFPTLPKPKVGGKVKILLPSLNEVRMHV